MPAIAATELIAELVVKAGSPERRIQILRQVAGRFLLDAKHLAEHHIGVFGQVTRPHAPAGAS